MELSFACAYRFDGLDVVFLQSQIRQGGEALECALVESSGLRPQT